MIQSVIRYLLIERKKNVCEEVVIESTSSEKISSVDLTSEKGGKRGTKKEGMKERETEKKNNRSHSRKTRWDHIR